jgi:hypothetical protein
MSTDHVNIGTLRRLHQLIEVGCDRCSHVVYVDPRALPFHGLTAVEDSYRRMRCSICGQKPSYSRPDARVIGVAGQYHRT